jgi:Na+/proline symporter
MQMQATLLFGLPLFAVLGLTFAWFGRRQVTFDSHFAANRSIGFFVAAISFPVCWTWANTLIIGPQKAYQAGLGEALWFAALNAMALAIFALCAWRLDRVARAETPTLTGYIKERYAPEMVWVYSVGISGIALYAVVGQFIGALVLIEYATGASKTVLVPMLAVMMALIALPRGVESSFAADMVKASMIAIVLVISLTVFGTTEYSAAGFAGQRGKGMEFLEPVMLSGFVLPLAISWLAGGALDHQLYQRARSLSPEAKSAVWWGILPFGAVVFVISSLGFLVGPEMMRVVDPHSGGFKQLDPQLAGFVAVSAWGAEFGRIFVVAVAAALLATGASALNAASSAWAVDIVRPWKPQWSAPWVSRGVMLLTLALAVVLALTGVTLLQMVLFIGAFRGALLFPTLLALWSKKRAAPSAIFAWGVAAAMVVCPLIAWWTTPFTGGLAALGITAALCLLEWRRNRVAPAT